MTWSAGDALVVTLAALQVGALAAAALAVRGIVRGPVANARRRIAGIAGRAAALADTARGLSGLVLRGQRIASHARATWQALRRWEEPAGFWITPATLRRGVRIARGVRAAADRARAKPRPDRARRPLALRAAERLGLVPPVLRHLDRLAGPARVALRITREARRSSRLR